MKAYLKVEQGDFFACGISLVIHPKSRSYQRFTPTFAILSFMTTTKKLSISGSEGESTSRPTICLMRMWYIFISNASRFVMRMTQRSIKLLRTNAIAIFGTRTGMRRAELGDCFLTIAVRVMNDR